MSCCITLVIHVFLSSGNVCTCMWMVCVIHVCVSWHLSALLHMKSALLRHWLKVSVSLVVIMGISWIIGVLTFHEALLFVSYIFTIIVAFQVLRLLWLCLKEWLVQLWPYVWWASMISLSFFAGCSDFCSLCDPLKAGNISNLPVLDWK